MNAKLNLSCRTNKLNIFKIRFLTRNTCSWFLVNMVNPSEANTFKVIKGRIFFTILIPEGYRAGVVVNRAHSLHRKWSCNSRTLGDDMLAARCLVLNSYLIDRYFSVHLTTKIGDVKLSTNVVYGRNDLRVYFFSNEDYLKSQRYSLQPFS